MAIKNRILRRSKNQSPAFSRRLLPTLVGSVVFMSQAQAIEFNLGEIEGRFDSQISVGASWRMDDPSSKLISTFNGGQSRGSGSYDDGNQNFSKGETFTQIVKGVHDLELRKDNVGFFGRAKYWYDAELEDGNRSHGHSPNGYTPDTTLNDSDFNDFSKFSGFEILDAYVFAGFDIGESEKPLDLRIGRQVINWGESTFIQGGLNSINPFDVNAFRRPGAEVKEGLLPVNMAFASLGLTDNLSVEGFYQLQWEPTAIDGCGTYFSTNDFVAEGCDGVRINVGALGLNGDDQAYFGLGTVAGPLTAVVSKESDREADDDGQFGIALRYFSEELNNTEFGFYAAKYHNRLPVASGIYNNVPVFGSGHPLESLNNLNSQYFVEYPEDVKMLGLSFSTNVGELAWSGEISHKMDSPMQINGTSLIAGVLSAGNTGNAALDAHIQAGVAGGNGTEIDGYKLFDITQLQTSLISFHDQVLGASRLTLVGEFGWTHVHGLDESANAIKFGRHGAYGYTAGDNEGFVTQDSYGYVLRANLNYPNAFAGVNLTPQISFKHGIDGFGPAPGAAFREGEKTLGLSLTADYLNKYSVQLSYTDYFGGDFNEVEDRDFISLSASVSF